MKRIHTIEALCKEIQGVTGIKDVYPSSFPTNAGNECIVVSFNGGQMLGTVAYPSLQVVCRADMPQRTYDIAVEVSDYLASLQDVRLVNGDLVIHCKKSNPFPLYLGQDENRRHMYSTNYTLILSDE